MRQPLVNPALLPPGLAPAAVPAGAAAGRVQPIGGPAVDPEHMREQLFTNIDSAVIA